MKIDVKMMDKLLVLVGGYHFTVFHSKTNVTFSTFCVIINHFHVSMLMGCTKKLRNAFTVKSYFVLSLR